MSCVCGGGERERSVRGGKAKEEKKKNKFSRRGWHPKNTAAAAKRDEKFLNLKGLAFSHGREMSEREREKRDERCI